MFAKEDEEIRLPRMISMNILLQENFLVGSNEKFKTLHVSLLLQGLKPPKIGNVVSYGKGLPINKSHVTLITCSRKVVSYGKGLPINKSHVP